VWRNNSGVWNSGGRFIRFGYPGSGDIIGVTRDGRFISIENKSNNEPTKPAQVQFADEVRWHNGIALIVKSLDDLIQQTEGLL